MATANLTNNFDVWLRKTLVDLDSDDDIMTPYITGILEADDPQDEKEEALQDVLAGFIESGIDELCQKILSKWTGCHKEVPETKPVDDLGDVNKKLSQLITHKAHTVVAAKTCSKEEEAVKQAILAQYGEISEDEDAVNDVSGHQSNSNADAVAKADCEKRAKDKDDSHKKKEKDKDDRSKQKTKDEDRKEKEKKRTQKGERRR